MKDVVKYIELKSSYSDNGPAWIARVQNSKSGKTIYFNGMALQIAHGGAIAGNHLSFDPEEIGPPDEYWVTGVKK